MTVKTILFVCYLCASLLRPALSECHSKANLVKLEEDVFLRLGQHAIGFEADNIANIGFIIGQHCVAVIDTGGSYEEGLALACAIKEITDKPVCYVINTHAHPDHILGNLAFKNDATQFIGHANLARAMAILGPTYLQRASQYAGKQLSTEHIVRPDIKVDSVKVIDLGQRKLTLRAHPVAHTDADLSVYDTDHNALWLGDLLFMEHVPVIHGSLNGWLHELTNLMQIEFTYVVPGHGPARAAWPQSGNDVMRYLTTLQKEIRTLIEHDVDIQDATDRVGVSEAQHWQLFEQYHKRNVITAYTEIEWE